MSSFDPRGIQPDASILNPETGEFKPNEPQVNIPPYYSGPTKEEELMKLFDDSPAEKAYKVAKFGVFAALGAVIVMFFSAIRTILKGPNSK